MRQESPQSWLLMASLLAFPGCGGGGGDSSETTVETTTEVMLLADLHFHARASLSAAEALAAMDAAGVRWAGNGPRGNDELWTSYVHAAPDRFLPFAGQGELYDILEAEKETAWDLQPGSQMWTYLADLESDLAAKKYLGIGEVAVNNEDSSDADPGLKFPATCALMFRLLQIAFTYQVPISIHIEADADSLNQLDSLLTNGSQATVLWAHCGTWTSAAKVQELMTKHPNLCGELAGRVELPVDHPTANDVIVDSGGQLEADWKALLEIYSDRFFIGTDENDDITKYQSYLDLYRTVLAQLSSAAAKNLAYQNAEKLFGLTP